MLQSTGVDWMALLWVIFTVAVLVLGVPVAFFPKSCPVIIERLYRFGKVSDLAPESRNSTLGVIVKWMQVPKSYFFHFYIFGTVYCGFLLAVLFRGYYEMVVPESFLAYLDCLAGSHRTATDEPVAVLVVQVLILCQVVRRAYECLFVSIYSPGTMNVVHYVMGLGFYYFLATGPLAQAPGFTSQGFRKELFERMDWKWYQLFGTAMYFWAASHQYKASKIFAGLRKNPKGEVVTKQHKIPEGDWFNYVSCPHFFAEILLYFSMNVVLKFQNSLMVLMWIFTLVNQTIIGLLNHQWYLEKFRETYPAERRAIFPYIL